MTTLLRCNDFIGGMTILDADPAVLDLSDVIYVPFDDPNSQPGLFDHGQKLVLQSWYFRGDDPLRRHTYLGTPYTPGTVSERAPDAAYVYGGWLHDHFGHFTLSSLCRFWGKHFADPAMKILVHAGSPVADWFARPWSASIFEALGLSADRFVTFDRPTRMRQVRIPAPAFQEDGFVHRVFATSLNSLGSRIAPGEPDAAITHQPVFLSKAHMRSGVQTILNEQEIVSVLDRNGVRIVFPEELSLADQIAVWRRHSSIASFAGSALHSGIFAPARDVTVISYADSLRSSYPLVDKVNGNTARYFKAAPGQIENLGTRDGFSTANLAHHPQAIAEDLLRVLDFMQRNAASRQGVPVWPRDGFWRPTDADPDEAGLLNLAVGQPAKQSSIHPWTEEGAGDAVSGSLSGGFSFHTDLEDAPWWEVDLGGEKLVHRIRLFNRLDDASERCERFVVALKGVEGEVRSEHRQENAFPFGGLDGRAFVWILPKPCRGRFVRVTLLDRNYLHLDQIEVLGQPDPSDIPQDQHGVPRGP